ncbi:hypothetical protein CDN99_16820 [Roseateles aquatilis]|uniref:Peptidase S9 prolyl oligopeptidase catalytic domain-containing protein n=1 Tax=Roseateles aquatilis TaxID=431061 RepID=A0A246J8D7_9BURK|nr:prolyl oligopeptidase family serine peptidase [Roseateles aquatilis]OWQ88514.1 hypothetical protein CDN99_16820 [Roseateles aquatilis]
MIRRTPDTRRRALVTAAALSPLAGFPVVGMAADAPASSLKVEDFFRNPVLSGARLSPDGKYVAGTRVTNGRSNIVVVDVATRKAKIITNFSDGDAGGLGWVNNKRLIFTVTDRQRGGGDQVGAAGLFAINADATNFVTLAERAFMSEGTKLLPPGAALHSLVLENGEYTDDVRAIAYSYQAKGKSSSSLYRVNTLTGRFSLLTLGAPGDAQKWLVDGKGAVRCCVTYRDETFDIHYRDAADGPWTKVYTYRDDDSLNSVQPEAIASDGRLYVTAYAGNDTAGLYMFDPKTGKVDPAPVFAAKGYDIDANLRFNKTREALLGIEYEAIKPGTYWLDEQYAALQTVVDKALPDTVNFLQVAGTGDERIALIASTSDRDPGRYYLYQVKDDKFQGLGATRPWIKVAEMRPTTFFRYAARDGMQIPAQLTLPAGDGKPPLVVLHYGGPWVRPIHMQWDPVVQFLASRGYAVFMPAPRASTGFGDKLFRAGWRQWGLAMQDDVTDGVKQLIEQGKVDPKRICIAGASYGGYLTMMGLVKEPELFRCGVNWVGVTDPNFMFSVTWTDFNRYGGPDTGRRRLIGDPEKDAEQFRRTSPLQRAAEIKQPVLMAYGAQDVRVPMINGVKMRDALRSHNKNVEWVVYDDEGHGWRKEANNVDFWSRVERFLAANMT